VTPRKHPNTERFGGPGSSKQDRAHPENFHKDEGTAAGRANQRSEVSNFLGSGNKHHLHDPKSKS
jgi:hypothetical protein